MRGAKKRADLWLVERGFAPSRERAQALILAGNVLVGDRPVQKSGESLSEEEASLIRLRGEDHGYVSRGALKLIGALDAFRVNPDGRVALDVGASTGGFTEVLLRRGAARVFALDVGHNQLAWKIRQDPRVVVLEKVNARNLELGTLGQKVSIGVMDVSFISITKILPALLTVSEPAADWITLIKPQFEVGRDQVGKGGIVTSPDARQEAVESVTRFAESLGMARLGLIESPITGTDGNLEYLAHWRPTER